MKLHQTERHGEVMFTAVDPKHGPQSHILCRQFHAGSFSSVFNTLLDSAKVIYRVTPFKTEKHVSQNEASKEKTRILEELKIN